MSREKKLIKDTFIYAFGNLFSKLIGFVLLPLYTKYLTVSDYGLWDIVTTTIMLLIPIIIFELNEGVYRYLVEENDIEKKKIVISTSMCLIIRNVIVFISLYIMAIRFINLDYKLFILLQICISCLYEMSLQIVRGLKRNKIYSFAGIVNTTILLSLNILFVKFYNLGLIGLFISNIVASSITLIYICFSIKINKYINLRFYNKKNKDMLIKYSIPLIPNVISWWIMNLADRYIINYNLGTSGNGIYAIANKLPTILFLANSIFYLAWQESAILNYNSKDRNEYYSKMFNMYMKFLISFSILVLAFTKLAFRIMVDSKFSDAMEYVPLLYLGTIFSAFSSFYGTGYHSAKDTKGAFTTSMYGALVNIATNWILIPFIGLQAASLSTMIGFLVMWLLRIKQTKKYFNIKINLKNIVILMMLFIFIMCLYMLNNLYLEVIYIAIAIIVFILSNKWVFAKLKWPSNFIH